MNRPKLPLRATPQTGMAKSRAIGRVTEVVKVDVQNDPLPVSLVQTVEVSVQDSTNEIVIVPMANVHASSTVAVETVPEDYTVEVLSAAGMAAGDHFRIINTTGNKYYFGTILGITGATITLDTPLDFAYVAGAEVTASSTNMNVDGSVTPVHFHMRTGSPSIEAAIDITRMLFICECADSVALTYFGDQPALTRGVVFRKLDQQGVIRNFFNVKTNMDLAALAYDLNSYEAAKQTDGINGFAWRLTFGSPGKMGAVIRVDPEGQLGVVIQDDLRGLLRFTCIVEGHVVLD